MKLSLKWRNLRGKILCDRTSKDCGHRESLRALVSYSEHPCLLEVCYRLNLVIPLFYAIFQSGIKYYSFLIHLPIAEFGIRTTSIKQAVAPLFATSKQSTSKKNCSYQEAALNCFFFLLEFLFKLSQILCGCGQPTLILQFVGAGCS